MKVEIVLFPMTYLALIEHYGAPELEHESVNKLIKWWQENQLLDDKYRNYGIHYTNPNTTPPEKHHVDFGISVDELITKNIYEVINKTIPQFRCAKARDIGSRYHNQAIIYLLEKWLPNSGENLGDFPPSFHYVNVGPTVKSEQMITDVYLPLLDK